MKNIIIGSIIISIFFGVVYLTYKLMISSANTFEKLRILKEKSKSAKNKEELNFLWEELKEINKECWHRAFQSSIIEIKTIIETKYEMLS